MGATVHSHSVTSRGSAAAAVLHACASSRIRINPACVAKPAAAVAAKKSKRPGCFHGGDHPAKRARGACGAGEHDAATKTRTCPRPSSDEDRCPRGSLRKGVEASCVTKNKARASPVRLPEVAEAPPKPPASTMRELLERARLAKARADAPAAADAEAVRRREIERLRAEARREREQMVPTVEFNEPFLDFMDFFK